MISGIHIENFLGVHYADLIFRSPIVIVAGRNGSGKSSIADAVRFAIYRRPGRVEKIKDFASLLPPGAKSGRVDVTLGDQVITRTLPGGEAAAGEPTVPDALEFATSARSILDLDRKARQRMLMEAAGVAVSGVDVLAEIERRGADGTLITPLAWLIRAGDYEGAEKTARRLASEARGAWEQITGERYGSKKAETWRPAAPEAEAGAPDDDLAQALTGAEERLASAYERLGRARERETIGRLDVTIAEKRGMAKRIAEKAAEGEARRAEIAEELERIRPATKPPQGIVADFACPDCGTVTRVQVQRGQITPAPEGAEIAAPEAFERVRECERRLATAEQWLGQKRADVTAIEAEIESLEELHAARAKDAPEETVEALQTEVSDLRAETESLRERIRAADQTRAAAANAEKLVADATRAHERITAYLVLAEQAGPAGVVAEFAGKARELANARLRDTTAATGWPAVVLDEDLEPYVDGRPVGLLSESERWRVDAALREAVVGMSGAGLLLLDRFDVLDLPNRAAAMTWLKLLAERDGYSRIIVLGTFKAPPAVPGTETFWLDAGRVAEQEKAA